MLTMADMWPVWVKQNWVALSSLAVSLGSLATAIHAVRINRRKLRHDTMLVLHFGRGPGGAIQIENTGPAAATGICLSLIEKVKQPSGKLTGADILRPKGTAIIHAYDYPKELEEEIERERLLPPEHTILKLNGQNPRIAGDQVAEYLLTREGNQLLVVRYRIAGESRVRLRLYRRAKNMDGFTEFNACGKVMCNRLVVCLLETV